MRNTFRPLKSSRCADQTPPDSAPFDDEDEDDEDAYDLREVSSDVEVNPDELGSDDEEYFIIFQYITSQLT
jgi:hypothetical protein